MDLIFLTTKLFGPGGIERFGRQVTKAADTLASAKRHNLWVFSLVDKPEDIPLGYLENRSQILCFGGATLYYSFFVFRQVITNSATIYVFHLHLAPIVFLARVLRPKMTYGVHLHGIEAWHKLPLIKRFALRKASFITTSSKFTAQKAAEMNKLDPKKIQVLYPSLDITWLESISSQKVTGSPGKTIDNLMLTVARLEATEKKKGVADVIKAIPGLLEEFPSINYYIVGGGDDLPRLRSLVASLEIENHVYFMGEVSDIELREYYQSCDLFIMPSSTEGLGIVYLEAMAFSKPVISGEYGGSSEVLINGETGLLVPYGDIPEIQHAIRTILGDKKLAKNMGIKGRQFLNDRFGIDVLSSMLEKVFGYAE